MNTPEEYPIGTIVCIAGCVSQWLRVGKVVRHRTTPAALIIEVEILSLRRGHTFKHRYIGYPVCLWNSILEINSSIY